MALAKVTVVDKIEVLEDGTVQVRYAMYVTEDGVRITPPTYHREVYEPGANVVNAPQRVKDISDVVWSREGR